MPNVLLVINKYNHCNNDFSEKNNPEKYFDKREKNTHAQCVINLSQKIQSNYPFEKIILVI